MSKAIGIDLGTGTTCIAYVDNGVAKSIVAEDGAKFIPSIVAWTQNGETLIGSAAKRQMITNSTRTVFEIKRIIGQSFQESSEDIKTFPFVVIDKANEPRIKIDDKIYSPQEVSSRVIMEAKKTAEKFLGETITDVVITVPARFDDSQKRATKEAAEIAGLNVLRLIPEPSAAILSTYHDTKKNFKCAVFDLGSGTFDISIIDVDEIGVFDTVTTDGDVHCGGKDIDDAISNWVVAEFKKNSGQDVSHDPMAWQRIKEASERAKCELSGQMLTEINLPFISADNNGPLHLQLNLSRAQMEQISVPFFEKIERAVNRITQKLSGGWQSIDEVLLVGGSSRIPRFVEIVEKISGKTSSKPSDVDLAVSLGAAIQAAILSGDKAVGDILLIEKLPISIGIEVLGDVFEIMVESDTTYPTKRSKTFSTAEDNQPAVTIVVRQGERPIASANHMLGRFDLTGLLPAPRGVPQIDVTFDIDANGLLTVEAKDKATGKNANIKITGSSQLSAEDIGRMKEEAQTHASADKQHIADIKILNDAESYVNQIDTALKNESLKIDDTTKLEIESMLSDLRLHIKQKNIEESKQKYDQLMQKWNGIIQTLYEQNNVQQKNHEQTETSQTNTDKNAIYADAKIVE